MTTGIIDLADTASEFVNFLRSNLTDSQNRLTFVSQYFSGDDSETDFTPTNTASWKCLDYVKVGGTTQSYGTDYTIEWTTGKITFITAPVTGVNNIEMKYGYGTSGAMVYPDMPRTDVIESSYPRVGVTTTINTEEVSVGGQAFKSDLRFSVLIATEDSQELDDLTKEIREEVLNNRKGFYNVRFVYPTNVADVIITENESGEKLGRIIEFLAPDRYEILS